MPRDETRDVLIICDENSAPSNEYSGFWYHRTLTAKSLPIAPKDSLERFSPHSQLVDLERQLADREDAIREAMALIESDYEDEAYNRLTEALGKP